MGAAPLPCPTAHYCEAGSETPTPCPAGTYGAARGLRAESECAPCDAGMFCETAGLSEPTGLCEPGYYCEGGASSATPTSDLYDADLPIYTFVNQGYEYVGYADATQVRFVFHASSAATAHHTHTRARTRSLGVAFAAVSRQKGMGSQSRSSIPPPFSLSL